MAKQSPLSTRLLSKIIKSDGCWEWTGTKTSGGYGMISVGRTMKPSHRVAYQILKGPIPDGKFLDHLCRNHGCQNPEHLEIVTHRENVLRGIGPTAINAAKVLCQKGHPFDIVRRNGTRGCSVCKLALNAEYRARNRGRIRKRERDRYYADIDRSRKMAKVRQAAYLARKGAIS